MTSHCKPFIKFRPNFICILTPALERRIVPHFTAELDANSGPLARIQAEQSGEHERRPLIGVWLMDRIRIAETTEGHDTNETDGATGNVSGEARHKADLEAEEVPRNRYRPPDADTSDSLRTQADARYKKETLANSVRSVASVFGQLAKDSEMHGGCSPTSNKSSCSARWRCSQPGVFSTLGGLRTVTASVDLIGFSTSGWLGRGTKTELERLMGERVAFTDSDFGTGVNVRIPRLTRHKLTVLDHWRARQRSSMTWSWAHIAFDLKFGEMERACPILRERLVIRYARNAVRHDYEESYLYWPQNEDGPVEEITSTNFQIGSGAANRHYQAYVKNPTVLRLEVRLFRAGTLKRYFSSPTQILDCDPQQIFDRHFALRVFKPRFVEAKIRQAVANHYRAVERRRPFSARDERYADSFKRFVPTLLYKVVATSPRLARHTVLGPVPLGVPITWLD